MHASIKMLLAATALATASTASAADFFPGTNVTGTPSAFFQVSGDPFDGSVSATLGRSGLGIGEFTDRFLFRLGQDGLGSGSLITSFAGVGGSRTDLDFRSVTFFNGVASFIVPLASLGNAEFGALSNIPIFNGFQNILTINYTSRGNGSFGGDLSFTPNAVAAVPEPAAWALMLFGFAGIGFSMRRRPKNNVRVKFAF